MTIIILFYSAHIGLIFEFRFLTPIDEKINTKDNNMVENQNWQEIPGTNSRFDMTHLLTLSWLFITTKTIML